MRLGVLLALVLLVNTTAPELAGQAGATGPAAAVTKDRVRWRSCGRSFECGAIFVPVDYSQPNGRRTKVALARARALEPKHRIGALVINFGGPGDPGTESLRGFVPELPREVRDRYDIVSFDPRGTGASHPINCISDRTTDTLLAVDPTPETDAQLREFYDGKFGRIDLIDSCVDRQDGWLARVGSRNVARDLDRIRAALGERTLDYLGYSYGTVIGAAYAQQFPDRVGRMVLDSPVNLSETAATESQQDGASFEHALDAFLRDCTRRARCRFHSQGRPRAALRTLQRRFEAGLTLPTRRIDGSRARRRAGVAAFYTALVAELYDKRFGWSDLAYALARAVRGDGTFLLALSDGYNGRRANGTYDGLVESAGIILCADRPDPLQPFDDWVNEYHLASQDHPFLGGFLTDTPAGCDPRLPRPSDTELLGDVRATGTAPILVVGTTGDPATPYAGARDLVTRLAGSRLLTFVSTEHTAYPKTTCVRRAVDGYLLAGRLPRVGTRCRAP
jgi:pimeloyl-ACP methyl ester carboxylesterase